MSGIIERFKGITNFGLLEFLFAIYPLLVGYSFGFIKFDLLFLLIIMTFALLKKGKIIVFKPLLVLSIFIILHEIILMVLLDSTPMYLINNNISLFLCLLSVFVITPNLDYERLSNAFMFIGVICMLGIVYHFALLQLGYSITPIKLPFLPDMNYESRLYELGNRPVSFFMEPASFITYMMIPLFISLVNKRMIWVAVIIVSIFLSTSSTGIILSMFLLIIYFFTEKLTIGKKLLIVCLSLVFVGFVLNTPYFEFGINKIKNTDIERTSRLINGPLLISSMPIKHLIFGMNTPNILEYYKTSATTVKLLFTKSGFIFVSSFWLLIAKFGIVGLLLNLNVLYFIARKYKQLIPYLAVLFVAMFSQGFFFNSTYVVQYVFILVFCLQQQKDLYGNRYIKTYKLVL